MKTAQLKPLLDTTRDFAYIKGGKEEGYARRVRIEEVGVEREKKDDYGYGAGVAERKDGILIQWYDDGRLTDRTAVVRSRDIVSTWAEFSTKKALKDARNAELRALAERKRLEEQQRRRVLHDQLHDIGLGDIAKKLKTYSGGFKSGITIDIEELERIAEKIPFLPEPLHHEEVEA